jgi:hypothetical protein
MSGSEIHGTPACVELNPSSKYLEYCAAMAFIASFIRAASGAL